MIGIRCLLTFHIDLSHDLAAGFMKSRCVDVMNGRKMVIHLKVCGANSE